MNNSFKENYHWVTLISIVLIYGYYFVKVLPPSGPDITAENVTLFAGLLVLLVVLHIVGAIVLIAVAKFNDPHPDERDQLVNLKGSRNASWILTTGVFGGMAAVLLAPGNFWVLHILLASLVVSQLVESATQIFHYRRGF